MKILDIQQEDFINYKEPSMYIIMPYCSFKCDKEYGSNICQNSSLAYQPIKDISFSKIISLYQNNPISKNIVLGGLEPFDSAELESFLIAFRQVSKDKVIIYTGYTEEEVFYLFPWILQYHNIIIKFGRFIPNQEKHYDDILGVYLASPNQYAKEYK